MKNLFLLLLISCSLSKVYSQGQGNTWIFGDSAGVRFINGQPIAVTSSICSANELSSSISDQQGNLLFYNGASSLSGVYCCTYVWDRNNQLMPNGNGLKGNASVTQGSLIVPMPGDTQKYYIFNRGDAPPFLYYSIVDMALNGGFGDVSQKNILLCDSVMTEKMIGIKHGNGRDWWVITHKYFSNNFYLFLISPYGINGPFIQSIGHTVSVYGSLGQMAINKDGNKLVLAGIDGELELFDFDRCTGLFTNPIPLGDPPYTSFTSYYGCSFSLEGGVLYASTLDSLFQFDLAAVNINASKTLIAGFTGSTTGDNVIGQHLLGPDMKIYIALTNSNVSNCDSLKTHLSVINNPDLLGTACNFSPFSFPLINCSEVYLGLPNMPNYNLGSLAGSVCDTVTAVEDIRNNYSINIYPNPVTNQLNIKTSYAQLSEITLYDIATRKLLQQTFTGSVALNTSQLAKGIYMYQITNKNRIVKIGKVVKE